MSTLDHINAMVKRKYDVLLKFLNKLLENMGKNAIDDPTKFQYIKRTELLTAENELVYDEMKDEIHKYFGKYNLKYAQKGTIKNYILTLLKNMCGELFLNFESKTVRSRTNKSMNSYVIYEITLQQDV